MITASDCRCPRECPRSRINPESGQARRKDGPADWARRQQAQINLLRETAVYPGTYVWDLFVGRVAHPDLQSVPAGTHRHDAYGMTVT
jgi:hypothetical protein